MACTRPVGVELSRRGALASNVFSALFKAAPHSFRSHIGILGHRWGGARV